MVSNHSVKMFITLPGENKMTYQYSAKNNAFFRTAELGNYEDAGWDLSDLIDVTTEQFTAFTQDRTVDGLVRIAGNDGMPTWGEIPPRTPEELEADAVSKKSSLIAYATHIIDPLKDAFDGDYIDDADKPKLTAWQKYRYALTKVDSANPVWPEMPI